MEEELKGRGVCITLVRQDMDVKEHYNKTHEKLCNIKLIHKVKKHEKLCNIKLIHKVK